SHSRSQSVPAVYQRLLQRVAHHPQLHSSPTRRSSDLATATISETREMRVPTSALRSTRFTPRSPWGYPPPDCSSWCWRATCGRADRKSTRLNSSHVKISDAVFCLE